jgi:hypothetical protein
MERLELLKRNLEPSRWSKSDPAEGFELLSGQFSDNDLNGAQAVERLNDLNILTMFGTHYTMILTAP